MSENGVILVCVTPQQSGAHLISCGRRLADEYACTLRIVSVLPQKQSFSPDLSVLESLNEAARSSGAEMTVCFSDSPADKVCEIVRESDVRMLLAGFPGKNSAHFLQTLHETLPDLPLWFIDSDGTAYSIGHAALGDTNEDGTYRVLLHSKPLA